MHSFRIVDDSFHWMNLFFKFKHQGRAVDAGVHVSAHAFAAKVKVGIYSCVSACLLKTKI